MLAGFQTSLLVSIALALAACTTPPPRPPEPPPPITEPAIKRPPKIGLALGGGAARGFAHVGVISALEEAGIKVDLVVGTSAGSLVAAIYASGKTSVQLQDLALRMEEAEITDWTLPFFSRGILRGEALSAYVNRQVSQRPIESLSLPLGIVATDLRSGQGVLFRRGDTGMAVRASSAVPAVFSPVKIGEREYVDGGLVSPVLVSYAKQMGADLIIAVDVSAVPEANAADGTLAVLLQTFAIMGKSINSYELRGADIVVRPNFVGVSSSDFAGKRRSIEAGKLAMRQLIAQLKLAIEDKTR